MFRSSKQSRQSKESKQNAKQKTCHFCSHALKEIDYKEVQTLQRFTSSYGKILPRKKTGICAKHQRKLAQAIKRARMMALIPFTTRV